MKRFIFSFLLAGLLFSILPSKSFALFGGPSADDIANANTKAVTNFLNQESPKWLTVFVNGAGNGSVNFFFIVYGCLSQFLIPIPNLDKSAIGDKKAIDGSVAGTVDENSKPL